MGESYQARELVVFHAIASPYRERSHFDGQDVLENGFARPHAVADGLAQSSARRGACGPRVVAQGAGRGARPERAAGDARARAGGVVVAVAARGAGRRHARAHHRSVREATRCSRSDSRMRSPPMPIAIEAQQTPMMSDVRRTPVEALQAPPRCWPSATRPSRGGARYVEVIRAAAGFLRRDDGPQIAVFDATGWDTHANEGGAQGQLGVRLGALDAGLRTLKEQLGPVWKDTAVLIATEFGRTAATNGTRGTDHGTGAAAFLLGGAVQGGRVIADWPGLSPRALYRRAI